MKKFTIAIEETIVQEFEIEADSAEEAWNIVERKYKLGEIVLESGEVQYKQMAIVNPSKEVTEWKEF